MTRRFDLPVVGPATPVRFPPIGTAELDNGVRVWTIARASAPVVAALLVVDRGSAFDPIDRPGLAGLTADLMDEGAGDRDAIDLADAFARMGTYLEIEVGPDVTTFGLTTPARHFPDSLSLLADVVIRPRLEEGAGVAVGIAHLPPPSDTLGLRRASSGRSRPTTSLSPSASGLVPGFSAA